MYIAYACLYLYCKNVNTFTNVGQYKSITRFSSNLFYKDRDLREGGGEVIDFNYNTNNRMK